MAASRDPLDLAAQALRHRDRSRAELDERLARAGVEEAERAEALATLERVGYVDDGRFAVSRAESLAARGHGDAAIEFDLKKHGIDRDRVADALAALEPEADRAAAIVARQGRTPKTAAHLGRKGFRLESIETALADEIAAAGEGGV